MTPITLESYLVVGAILFGLGMVGFLARRNLIIMFLSAEMMLQGVAINLVAFSQWFHSMDGQAFAIFVITDAAAEAAIGLGLIIALFRNKETVNADEIDLLKW